MTNSGQFLRLSRVATVSKMKIVHSEGGHEVNDLTRKKKGEA